MINKLHFIKNLSSLYFTKSGKSITTGDIYNQLINSTDRELIWPNYSRASTRVVNYTPASIYTPMGSLVSDTYYRPEELNDEQKTALLLQVENDFPDVTIISAATTTYNCHGYAWSVADGGETVWMGCESNPTSINWTDGSYMSTTSTYGTKISYLSDNHSAVRTGTPNVFISKWGYGPLVRHQKDDCPYDASSLSYYKIDDRPDIYIGQSIDDYTGAGPTIYSSTNHTEFTLHAYPHRATVTRYVWSASFTGNCSRWYTYPNNDVLSLSMYFANQGDSGQLNVSCSMYNGSTLVGVANYYVVIVYL